jgi:hypothetical protein
LATLTVTTASLARKNGQKGGYSRASTRNIRGTAGWEKGRSSIEGRPEGIPETMPLGLREGRIVGTRVGMLEGLIEGRLLGDMVGEAVGVIVGVATGWLEGNPLGRPKIFATGIVEGKPLGRDGTMVGNLEGTRDGCEDGKGPAIIELQIN